MVNARAPGSKIDLADIDREGLGEFHRGAMLDCILAWAHFESQFRAMLSAVKQLPLDEGAREFDRLQLSIGWTKLRQALRDRGATPEVLARITELKVQSTKHSEPRNFIAHAGCIGTLRSRPEYIVFAPFESNGPGELTILATPVEEIERSTAWAKGAGEMANRILLASGH